MITKFNCKNIDTCVHKKKCARELKAGYCKNYSPEMLCIHPFCIICGKGETCINDSKFKCKFYKKETPPSNPLVDKDIQTNEVGFELIPLSLFIIILLFTVILTFVIIGGAK